MTQANQTSGYKPRTLVNLVLSITVPLDVHPQVVEGEVNAALAALNITGWHIGAAIIDTAGPIT